MFYFTYLYIKLWGLTIMSRKLRVFISSTMKDLSNERDQVCRKLKDFNLEPVNAEGLLSDGQSSWDKLAGEINTCDIFILILGDRYGWIPNKGPKSNEGDSVTHSEYKEAITLGLPILTFSKELSYDADRKSKDAKRRDAFRTEVMSWESGRFNSNFTLASDLAEKVGAAIILMLSDEFQKGKIKKRAEAVDDVHNRLKVTPIKNEISKDDIPSELLEKLKKKEVVLFAGSGVSLSTGLPSAAAFSERLAQEIRVTNPEYSMNAVGSVFAGIATDLEVIRGREFLYKAVSSMIHPPQGAEPSSAHMDAVQWFDQIITTNYDTLFEEAAKRNHIQSHLIFTEINDTTIPVDNVIIKLHGTIDKPDSLLLTEKDVLFLDKERKNLWDAIVKILNTKTIVVVGSSLRDPSIIRLLTEAKGISGYFVTPEVYEYTQGLTSRWNLKCIKADADSFFRTVVSILQS